MPFAKPNIRLIDSNELVLGEPLPGDLRDADGRILVVAGTNLSSAHLRKLGQRVITGLYAGPDWGDVQTGRTVSASEVMDDLFRRSGQAKPSANQREHARHDWAVPLTLVIEERGEYGAVAREIEVTSVDISLGGFAFTFRQYIGAGTRVRAQFDMLPHQPRVDGVVRSCRLAEGHRHRIGVEFLTPKRLDAANDVKRRR